MIFENIPLPSLPTYIIATLILSYILWSKFFNEGSLKVKTADDLLDLYVTFLTILPIFLGIAFIILLIPSFFSIEPGSPEGWNDIVVFFVLLALVLMALNKEEITKKDLEVFSTNVLKGFTILSVLTLSVHLSFNNTPLAHILLPRFFLIFILFFIPAFMIMFIFQPRFFELIQLRLNKNFLKQAIPIILIGILLFFSFPRVFFPDYDVSTQAIGYTLTKNPEIAMETIDVNYDILRNGGFGLFSLEFGQYFEPQRFTSMRFHYPLNSKSNTSKTFYKTTENDLSIGIKDWKIDEKNKAVFVEVDQDIFKEKGIFRITLRGEREKNISKLFIFTKGEAPDCTNRNCTVNLTFINKLNLRISGERVRFFAGPIFYGGNCKLHGADIKENVFNSILNKTQLLNSTSTCNSEEEYCTINGIDFSGEFNHKQTNYFVPVDIQFSRNLRMVDLNLKISCQS